MGKKYKPPISLFGVNVVIDEMHSPLLWCKIFFNFPCTLGRYHSVEVGQYLNCMITVRFQHLHPEICIIKYVSRALPVYLAELVYSWKFVFFCMVLYMVTLKFFSRKKTFFSWTTKMSFMKCWQLCRLP